MKNSSDVYPPDTHPPLLFHPAEPSDLAALREIYNGVGAWLHDEKGITDQWDRVISDDEIRSFIDENATVVLMEGEPVAAFRLTDMADVPWDEDGAAALYVHSLAVRRQYAHRGVGRRALAWIEETARTGGKRFVRLDCMAENVGLRRYYAQAGFRDLGRHPVHTWFALYEKGVTRSSLRSDVAVIFDMDGLMLDTERLARVAWERAMADWDYMIPDDVYLKLIGRTVPDVREILRESLDKDLPFEEIRERKQMYLEEEIARGGIPVKPGLLELLSWLDGARVPKAVASSTFREIANRKLEVAGLAGRFDVIVCGDEISKGKPNPDIFLAAATKLAILAVNCVVLEDSEAGITAAHAAGMLALLVPDLKPPSKDIAGLAAGVFPSLLEVKSFLRDHTNIER